MSESELQNYIKNNEIHFKNIAETMKEMKELLSKIDERQQIHYADFISLQKDVEYSKKEICTLEKDVESKVRHIWEEIRRRDRKSMWLIGILIIIIIPIFQSIITYISKIQASG